MTSILNAPAPCAGVLPRKEDPLRPSASSPYKGEQKFWISPAKSTVGGNPQGGAGKPRSHFERAKVLDLPRKVHPTPTLNTQQNSFFDSPTGERQGERLTQRDNSIGKMAAVMAG